MLLVVMWLWKMKGMANPGRNSVISEERAQYDAVIVLVYGKFWEEIFEVFFSKKANSSGLSPNEFRR